MFQNLSGGSVYIMGLAIIVLLFLLAGVRFLETRRIERKFPKDRIVISSFGVNYYGLASEPGPPRRSVGALVLLKDGLYYRARYLNLEVFIPGGALTKIEVVDSHKGKLLYHKMLSFAFVNENKKMDSAVFMMPHPSQWWNAVETLFLKGGADARQAAGTSKPDGAAGSMTEESGIPPESGPQGA